jgi:hypothetical protein
VEKIYQDQEAESNYIEELHHFINLLKKTRSPNFVGLASRSLEISQTAPHFNPPHPQDSRMSCLEGQHINIILLQN